MVVETDTVVKSYFRARRGGLSPEAGTSRSATASSSCRSDNERAEMRDPHWGFVSYVPGGAVAKGQALVTTGGGGKTLRARSAMAPSSRASGDVPGIAGRSPGNIARELYYIQTGDRAGPVVALMQGVVINLTADDILNISAYVASLQP